MKKVKALLLSVILIVINISSFGVPAYPYPVEITQPDGTRITIILKGDEHIKWAETVDGYTILRNSKDIYEYAILNSGNDLVPSGIRVRNQSERSSSDIQSLANIPKGLSYSRTQVGLMRSISGIYENKSEKAFPTTGSRKLVCILMGYTDVAFTKTQADLENLFNQVGYNSDGATGSINDFYKESSYNQLDLTVTVAGPYTASNTMAYYGANDSYDNDIRPRELVTEAVNLADPDLNYSDFDNDNDGTVDGVYIIYAGYGEEYTGVSSNAIWAHAWSITPVTLDGKTISRYSCSSELRGNSGTGLTRIGVICHEFGHVLGAMDFYDTDYATNGQYNGTGTWDLMSSGSWNNTGATPASHNPYIKIYSYGWATATTLSSLTSINIKLNDAEKNSNSFYRVNTVSANEFFLIENRQQYNFDSYIPGHGMIIYHVDGNYISTAGNRINAGSHQGMYPVCASATGNPPSTYGVINNAGLPFPGTSLKTSFTDATIPASICWAGANTNKPITDITENTVDKTVSFNFILNSTAPSAITLAASEIYPESATLNAQVSANFAPTTVTFEYGTTTSYGTSVDGTPNLVSGDILTNITADITGLTPNTDYNFRVKAVNSVNTTYGENMTFNPVVLNLPVTENFDVSYFPKGWTTQNTGTGITERWSMSNTVKAGGTAYELKCTFQNISPGITRVITPAINTTGESGLTLSFKHLFYDISPGATLRIQSSTDKLTWTDETWSYASGSGTIGPETVSTTITNNLNSPTTYIAFEIDGNLYQFDYWYIDNVLIKASRPAVATSAVSTVTSTTASCGGNVTDNGGFEVLERGVCWSTEANPGIDLSTKTLDGTGNGIFSSSITGLTPGITYHVRAYATNSTGTGYGEDIQFTLGTVVNPTLSTVDISAIGPTTATSGGIISFDGCAEITAKGVCWSTETNPTVALNTKTTDGTGVDVFTSNITGLTPLTTYYLRAYATNSLGTGYGAEEIFTTLPAVFTMNNDPVTTCMGIFYDSGGESGYYSNSEDFTKVFTPATAGNKMSFNFSSFSTESGWDYLYIYDGPDISSPQFTGSPFTGTQAIGTITASSQNTTGAITFRFHSDGVINNTGWAADISCVILVSPPIVTTIPVTTINPTTAACGGNVTDNGGFDVTEKGVCWSTETNPTVALGTKTVDGTGIGAFTSTITGLTPGTTYYVRAYATNSTGTGYGSEIQFALGTVVNPTLTTIPVSSISQTSALSGGIITFDGCAEVTAKGVCWSTETNPTIALDTKTTDGTGIDAYTSNITGLTTGTTYYLRAYATNSSGTGYGSEIIFTASANEFLMNNDPVTTCSGKFYDSGGESGSYLAYEDFTKVFTPSTPGNKMSFNFSYFSTESGYDYLYIYDGPDISSPQFTGSPFTGTQSIGTITASSQNTTGAITFRFSSDVSISYSGWAADISCVTIASPPTVTTNPVATINPTTAATGGNVTVNGGFDVTEKGVCWSTETNPTVELVTKTVDGTGLGAFTSTITGLTAGTTYYVRAYATNSTGTGYGSEIQFALGTVVNPTLTTIPVSSITQTTAISGGIITFDGCAEITAKGVCWSTETSPTTALDTKTTDGTGIEAYTSNITGLTPGTTYYLRAYATNSSGTGYGAEVIFTASTDVYTMNNDPVITCSGKFYDSGGESGTYLTYEDFTKVFTPATPGNKMSFNFSSFYTESNYDYLYIYDGPDISSPQFTGSPFTGSQSIGTITASSGNTTGAITFRFHSDVSITYSGWAADISCIAVVSPPVVTTYPVTSINQTTAASGGNVTDNGGFDVTEKGVCWSTETNPTAELITKTVDGTGLGAFTSTITGLTAGTTYYVRAYATNSTGTGYGSEIQFALGTVVNPTLTTIPVSLITYTTATSGGIVTFDGCAEITSKGVCWSTETNPTIALDTKTTDGTGVDAYTSNITGLTPGTTYYVRAYATNSSGTGYGAENVFTTVSDIYVMNNDPITTCSGKFYDSGGDGGNYLTYEDFTKVFTPAIPGNKMSFNFSSFYTESNYDYLYIYDGPDISSTQFPGSPFTGSKTIGIITASLQNTTGAITFRFHSDVSINYSGWAADISCITIVGPPVVTTSPVTLITSTTASSGGEVTDEGGATVTEKGVCWSTDTNPTVELTTKTIDGTGFGAFTSTITGLTPGITYHVRAYATNSAGTGYGADTPFTTCTIAVIPTITTSPVSSITTTTAISGGIVSSGSCADITERGVCWSTSVNPTIDLSTKTTDGTGEGSFISNISGLTPGVLYYVRAYATNSAGTGYGIDIPFTTCTVVSVPILTTVEISDITSTTAASGGIITASGCSEISARGICWSTTANPTAELSTHTTDGTGEGSFISIIQGLTGGTTYHFRAYATNATGTGYGNDISFITLPSAPVANIATDVIQTSFTASWNSSLSATGYHLDVSVNSSFTTFISGYDNKDIGNILSTSVAGLSANTPYYYRVRAYSSAGTSTNSNIITVTTLQYLPPAPVANSATNIVQTYFIASWSSSVYATGYKLDVSPDIAFATFLPGYNNKDIGNVLSTSVTGLSANLPYYYRVRAYNSAGTSANSNTITAITLPYPPDAPVADAATNIIQTSFTASWSSTERAAGYRLDVSSNNSFSTFITGFNNKDIGDMLSASITGLNPNSPYYYRVRAYNTGGTSSNSNIISVTTLPIAPTAPIAYPATNISQTSFTANWGISSTATGYSLDVATNIEFTSFITGFNNKDIGNVTSTNISGLDSKTQYYFRVRGYNTGGTSGSSNIVTATTLTVPPASPTGLSAFSCNNLVTLKWRKNNDPYFTRYRIYSGTTNDPTSKIDSTSNGISDTLRTISGLTNGQTYYFRLTAVNYDGPESQFSTSSAVKIKTGVIPRIKAKWNDVLICYNLGDSITSFQWYKGSSAISDATNQYFRTNKQPGIYNVETIDMNGCLNHSNAISTSETKSLSVYPNPASENFTLKLNNASEGGALISILTSSGIKVMEFKVKSVNDELLKEVPVTNLDEGIYLIQVLMDNQDLFYSKIVVIK